MLETFKKHENTAKMMKRTSSTTMIPRYSNASYYTTTILLLLATTGFQLASANTLQPRIVGGQDATFGEYPFFTSWGTSCGATLIHDDILLTAAHVSRDKDQTIAVFGLQKGSRSKRLGPKSDPKIDKNSGSKKRGSKVEKCEPKK